MWVVRDSYRNNIIDYYGAKGDMIEIEYMSEDKGEVLNEAFE